MSKGYPICCETPLISTLSFAGAEFFCRHCRRGCGLFDDLEYIEVTPAFADQIAANRRWFEELFKDMIPPRVYYSDCEACRYRREGYHREHASREELARSRQAYRNALNPEYQGVDIEEDAI